MSKRIHDFTEVVDARVYRVRLVEDVLDRCEGDHFYLDHEFDVLSLSSRDKISGSIWESKNNAHPHWWNFSLNTDSISMATVKFVADVAILIERLRVRLGLKDVKESQDD